VKQSEISLKIFGFRGAGSKSTKKSGRRDLDSFDWILEIFFTLNPLEVSSSLMELGFVVERRFLMTTW
jgi:hypothetical protein